MIQRNILNWKERPFFGANQFANAAADNQMTIKKPRRLIVDQPFPHSQKDSSSIEEKMFSKVTLPSTLINFFSKRCLYD